MSDLICANCKHFNRSACLPRCLSNYYEFAQSETPACPRFVRFLDLPVDFQTNLTQFRRRLSDAQA